MAMVLAMVLVMGWATGPLETATAQLKLSEGESVKVYFLNDFRDGVVLKRQGDRYGVEFQFGAGTQQKVFERQALRMMCEVDALDFSRTWTSGSGQFKVDAALKAIEGDQVVLTKFDLSEITVPLASLSPKDVTYVERLKKNRAAAVQRGEVPAATPALPDVEEFTRSFGEFGTISIRDRVAEPLGELPSYLNNFSQAGTGFRFLRPRQELVAMLPVGGPEQLVLMTAREDNFFNRGIKYPSQLYWVSLKQAKVVGTVYITSEDYALDYDPRARRLVSYQAGDGFGQDRGGTLTVWELAPGGTEIKPLVRWTSNVGRYRDQYVKLINERIVLTKSDRHQYIAWDYVDKKELYSLRIRNFFDPPIEVTRDRKHLLLPEEGIVTVLDAATGSRLFQLSAGGERVSGVCLSEDGKRVAGLTSSRLYVWDLTQTGSQSDAALEAKVYAAPLIGNPFEARMSWLDEDHVLVEGFSGQTLFRLSLALPIWSYKMDVWQDRLNRDPLRSTVLDGHYFYVAQPDRFDGSIAVGAVKLPGPQVDEITRKIDKESLYVIKPGVEVALGEMKVTDVGQVEAWLSQKIADNGWVLNPAAEIRIDCEMGRGETQSETYRSIGGGGGTTTVTFTPHFATLKIRQGSALLWQGGTSTGAPSLIRGDDIQGQIETQQVPQLAFFQGVQIPDRIIDPKFSNGFGTSQFGLRGIEVVSTSPPGRESDPEAALNRTRQADEQAQDNANSRADDANGPNPPGASR
jgi:hypothetical protein